MAAVMGANHHGKGRVRIVKVFRSGDQHSLLQFNVELLLEGPMDPAFTQGDNSIIIPTDTQKNTVYIVAKREAFDSAEEFAVILARHFLATYPVLVTRCRIHVKEDLWDRMVVPGAGGRKSLHNHSFVKVGPQTTYARAEGMRDARGTPAIKLWAGVKGLTVLKTTQSSFVNFHKDMYTSLPEASDRLMGTCMDGEWAFDSSALKAGVNFRDLRRRILDTLLLAWSGPAHVGKPSASVQVTCYEMASALLAAAPLVTQCTLYMPNVHNLPFDLSKYGMHNADHTGLPDIFYPVDEPHGIIQATVHRPRTSKL